MHYLVAEAGGWPSIRMTQKEKQEPHEQGGAGKGKIDSGMNLEREVGEGQQEARGEVKLDPRSGSHPLVPTEIAITEVDALMTVCTGTFYSSISGGPIRGIVELNSV